VFRTAFHSRALAAENLFQRKQLAFYQERKRRPRRATDAVRFTRVLLARFFDEAGVDHPQAGYSDSMASKGIPTILETGVLPPASSDFPRAFNMVRNTPSGAKNASELLLRIQISPRPVRRHMPSQPRRRQSKVIYQSFQQLMRIARLVEGALTPKNRRSRGSCANVLVSAEQIGERSA